MSDTDLPPMEPDTSEATQRQLDLARAQGEAYTDALRHMTEQVANAGGLRRAGDYVVGYAVEDAEGMYRPAAGGLVWEQPGEGNVHVEITVQDAADGRFVPGLDVTVVLVGPHGDVLGPERHELLWHPMLYHYGRNWTVPVDGEYTIRVHIDPPQFMRHDEVNGRRFTQAVDVEFARVPIERGSEPVDPPA